jgi:UDP-N-acetylglucosamine 4-epimerase
VARLLNDEPCEIHGDGQTSRDFCFVDNAVQANVLAATVEDVAATGGAYNVACGEETSLNELFNLITRGLSRFHPSAGSAKPQYTAPRQGDIRRSLADIGKARRLLGYEPTHRVAAGLEAALGWYAARQTGAGAPVVR